MKEKSVMSDLQRDVQVKQALKRFVRNRNLPEEMENLRYNLIVARVLSGMTAVEAADKFGYKNSTQISLIESGERPTPKDHRFLRQAANVYFVSCDFLLGLSPHMEYDSKVTQQHALLRGTQEIMEGIATLFTTSMIQFTHQTQPVAEDFTSVAAAVDRVESALTVLRKHGLDGLRGSATIVHAVEGLSTAVAPIRKKVERFKAIDLYFAEVKAGTMPAIPHLIDRYRQQDLGLDG